MKKTLTLLLLVIFGIAAPSAAEPLETTVTSITTSGALVLDLAPAQLFRAGLEVGDLIDADIDGQKLRLPYCRSYSEVLIGRSLLFESSGSVFISTNYGHFAGDAGLAEWDGKYWQRPENVAPIAVTLTLAQKNGYAPMREKLRLRAGTHRGEYDTDEAFANFRAVRGGKLGDNVLYRSSTPASVTRPRAAFADRLAEKAAIKTVLNMANSPERLKKVMDSPQMPVPYYHSLYENDAVIARAMPAALDEEKFRVGLAEELRFLIAHPAPCLVHCAEGKDRTGFVCYLLAAFMGATPDELKNDYGESFTNHYFLPPGSEIYELLVEDGLAYFDRTLGASAAPLSERARAYLISLGLKENELALLEQKLRGY